MVSNGNVLVRYIDEHDTSTPEQHHETYEPYLHVLDIEGKNPITKGAGGQSFVCSRSQSSKSRRSFSLMS